MENNTITENNTDTAENTTTESNTDTAGSTITENSTGTAENTIIESNTDTAGNKTTAGSANLTEAFFKKLSEDKLRLSFIIIGIISVICSFLYISQTQLIAPVLIAALFVMLAGIANIIYGFDIHEKNSHSNNIVFTGIVIVLAGWLIRVIQMGFTLHWQSFIAYFLNCAAMILTAAKLGKNKGREMIPFILLIILAFYNIFEFFYIGSGYMVNMFWKMFYLSEALLLVDYALLILLNRGRYEEFAAKLGGFKIQIPSERICLIILAEISALSLIAGGIYAYVSKTPGSKTVSDGTITTVTETSRTSTSSSATSAPDSSTTSSSTVIRGSSSDTHTTTESSTSVSSSSSASTSVGASTSVSTSTSVSGSSSAAAAPLTIGQTVTPQGIEFTLNKVVFSHRVEPDVKPIYYSYYDAKSGQVYIYANATVKNLQQNAVGCDEIYSVTVDYDNGYTYSGFNIADDTDGDFTYANITNVDPLQTRGVHCLIDCPAEVETSSKPVKLTFRFKDGTQYIYNMR